MIEFTSTFRNVAVGAAMLGVTGGLLGSFAFLRRQSLLGDALAHAALPGVCLAFLLTGAKSSSAFLAGALFSGIIGALFILAIVRWTKIKDDSAIGIILSVFFAVGIVLLTVIQKLPGGNQSGLDKYLFGQAATMSADDVTLITILCAIVIGIVLVFFKEFKLVSFDRDFGASIGYPVRRIEILMTVLLVAVVVIGLQMVGVVLMVATLVTPAAAARQWTDRLGMMTILAATIGGFSGAVGATVSATFARSPTGPVIVLVASAILTISLLFAPARGILWARLRERRVRTRIKRENVLKDLHRLGESGAGMSAASPELRRLASEGLVEESGDVFRLTKRGDEEAGMIVRKHRLWEVYLSRRLDLPLDHLHRDAEMMEHVLTSEAVDDLDARLGFPEHDPHGRVIPR